MQLVLRPEISQWQWDGEKGQYESRTWETELQSLVTGWAWGVRELQDDSKVTAEMMMAMPNRESQMGNSYGGGKGSFGDR